MDSDVVGCCWIELPKGKYRLREEKGTADTDSQYPGKVGLLHLSLHYKAMIHYGSVQVPNVIVIPLGFVNNVHKHSPTVSPSGFLVSV